MSKRDQITFQGPVILIRKLIRLFRFIMMPRPCFLARILISWLITIANLVPDIIKVKNLEKEKPRTINTSNIEESWPPTMQQFQMLSLEDVEFMSSGRYLVKVAVNRISISLPISILRGEKYNHEEPTTSLIQNRCLKNSWWACTKRWVTCKKSCIECKMMWFQ